MPSRLIAADHTGFTVSNLEESLAFWRNVLGFELSHRAHHTGELASEVTGVPGAEILIAVLRGYGHKIELLQYLAPADRKKIACRISACRIYGRESRFHPGGDGSLRLETSRKSAKTSIRPKRR